MLKDVWLLSSFPFLEATDCEPVRLYQQKLELELALPVKLLVAMVETPRVTIHPPRHILILPASAFVAHLSQLSSCSSLPYE